VCYCSTACQKAHWNSGHRFECCPPVCHGLCIINEDVEFVQVVEEDQRLRLAITGEERAVNATVHEQTYSLKRLAYEINIQHPPWNEFFQSDIKHISATAAVACGVLTLLECKEALGGELPRALNNAPDGAYFVADLMEPVVDGVAKLDVTPAQVGSEM
jgi:hypothetical protein